MYILVMCFGRKSNFGCQINCQWRYLYGIGKWMLSWEISGQHYLHIYCIYYVYSFMPCKLQVHMLSNGIYTDITPHNWDQAVESFEFKLWLYAYVLLEIWPLFLNM